MADQIFMENLEEYVNDANKIVSYKWLSRTLGVHVNEAKQMLHSFVEKERNEKDNDKISVVYMVSGVSKTDKVHRICVIQEEQLEATKAQLDPVTSCHVYSVQQAKLKDSNALYTADYDLLKEQIFTSNKYSAIKCTLAKLRSADELKISALKINESSTEKSAVKNNKSSTADTKPKKTESDVSKKGGPGKKSSPQGKQGIASMFTKAEKKSAPESEKSVKSAAKGKPKQAGVMSFFNKQSSKPAGKATKKESPVKSKKKRDDDSDEDVKKPKKRRVIESSSESESEEEMMEEEPMPPTPPREATPPPQELTPTPEEPESPIPKTNAEKTNNKNSDVSDATQKGHRRKRKRKLVPKTSIDEDGFMVTEKVWESDSTDASDVEPPPPLVQKSPNPPSQKRSTEESGTKKETKTKAPAKKQSKANTKQTSLMNFFKKS
ncbi:unnamed protein product [Owenia fusiformis]|uniref:DNA polymerase delta subunit 3 n=1 Tax=Owenia fusiformis TaxID=6347 RepID=A0A8J1TS67_OWEFU|nr:unnamed protein product [Owenia fusiformis]